MISLILPYWQRQEALDKALQCLATQYFAGDLEVVIVDDGSPVPYELPADTPFDVVLERLPGKVTPRNPCVPLNVAVGKATEEYIALSCAEILHNRAPVLEAMREQIEHLGRDAYVTAACWAPDEKRWHAHSTVPPMADDFQLPYGSHFHFLSMMHRSLWDKAGGFDEEYREGAGYEDADFLMRLQRAGADFVLRDDLVVEHPRAGTRAAWTRAMHERNRQIFRSKWLSPSPSGRGPG